MSYKVFRIHAEHLSVMETCCWDMKCFSRTEQDIEETEVMLRLHGGSEGAVWFPLMTLPVKAWGSASATVVRGPASDTQRGRESDAVERKVWKVNTFDFSGKDVVCQNKSYSCYSAWMRPSCSRTTREKACARVLLKGQYEKKKNPQVVTNQLI